MNPYLFDNSHRLSSFTFSWMTWSSNTVFPWFIWLGIGTKFLAGFDRNRFLYPCCTNCGVNGSLAIFSELLKTICCWKVLNLLACYNNVFEDMLRDFVFPIKFLFLVFRWECLLDIITWLLSLCNVLRHWVHWQHFFTCVSLRDMSFLLRNSSD